MPCRSVHTLTCSYFDCLCSYLVRCCKVKGFVVFNSFLKVKIWKVWGTFVFSSPELIMKVHFSQNVLTRFSHLETKHFTHSSLQSSQSYLRLAEVCLRTIFFFFSLATHQMDLGLDWDIIKYTNMLSSKSFHLSQVVNSLELVLRSITKCTLQFVGCKLEKNVERFKTWLFFLI